MFNFDSVKNNAAVAETISFNIEGTSTKMILMFKVSNQVVSRDRWGHYYLNGQRRSLANISLIVKVSVKNLKAIAAYMLQFNAVSHKEAAEATYMSLTKGMKAYLEEVCRQAEDYDALRALCEGAVGAVGSAVAHLLKRDEITDVHSYADYEDGGMWY